MSTVLPPRLQSSASLTEADLRSLRATAQMLAQANAVRPLAGKHLAVVWHDEPGAAAAPDPASAYEQAAAALGARVSHLRLDERVLQGDAGTAPLLARLYDAVACESLDAAAAARLQRRLGIPVYGGVTCADHPLAPLWAGASETERACLLQALLLSTIA